MPVAKLLLQPGTDLQSTPTLNKTKWAQTQLVRFYEGLIQKIGGWARYSSTPVIGTCRALLGWADLAGNVYVATGTEQRLQVLIGGLPLDITPLTSTTNNAVNFSTTSGSKTITIVDTSVPNKIGDWINIITPVSVGGLIISGFYQAASVGSGTYTITAAANATATVSSGGAVADFAVTSGNATVTVTLANHGLVVGGSYTIPPVLSGGAPVTFTVGGITLSGTYMVQTVTSSSVFTITGGSVASSTASAYINSGNAQIDYLISSGNLNNVGVGFGSGYFGSGYWGQSNGSSAVSTLRIWSLDHWGQDLVAAPAGGSIYYWAPGTAVPAQRVSNTSPLYVNWIFVVPEVQILVALGAESGGTQYPLLVRWCDAADFTDWTPSVSNQAGSFQLNSGSTLVFGAASGLTLYLWTDLGVWSVTYQGLPYVFSFNELARECGAIAPNAVAIAAMGAVWLSGQGFFQLTGAGVQPLECPVWDFYFTNINTSQLQQIISALNTAYHEVSWYFPMTSGGMGYVKWNWLENAWDYGVLTRTAWMDASPAGNCMGVDANGLVQQHEIANDADGQPITAYAISGYFDLQDGDDYAFCDMLIPDFVSATGATLGLTVYSQDYPEGTVKSDGPYVAQLGTTKFVTCNSRGRQMAIGIQSADAGSSWRLGALRYRFRPDGKI